MITFESANWVEQKIGQDGFLILDPRSSMQYLKGHIKGAISFPVKKLFDSNGKLLEVNQLEQVLVLKQTKGPSLLLEIGIGKE